MTRQRRQPASNGPSRTRRRGMLTLAFLGPIAALLIWGKLRFVSEVPRTAYADPKAAETSDGRQPE